jgi:hypothetical protein
MGSPASCGLDLNGRPAEGRVRQAGCSRARASVPGMNVMRAIAFGLAVLAGALCSAGCRHVAGNTGCEVNGPAHLVPATVKRVRLGMSKPELERILGEVNYSPIEGQYYFSTGGECPLEGANRNAPCGVVADFRRAPEYRITGSLQSCTWGAIGE